MTGEEQRMTGSSGFVFLPLFLPTAMGIGKRKHPLYFSVVYHACVSQSLLFATLFALMTAF